MQLKMSYHVREVESIFEGDLSHQGYTLMQTDHLIGLAVVKEFEYYDNNTSVDAASLSIHLDIDPFYIIEFERYSCVVETLVAYLPFAP